jgi:hypothetical protein
VPNNTDFWAAYDGTKRKPARRWEKNRKLAKTVKKGSKRRLNVCYKRLKNMIVNETCSQTVYLFITKGWGWAIDCWKS